MKGIIRSQAGFTITEIMVVIALSGFLMAAAAVGFATFFAKFNELSAMSDLQHEAFACMQKIKNGIPIGSGNNIRFSGIASADSAIFLGSGSFGSSSSGIQVFPPKTDVEHSSDWVKYYYDASSKAVRAQYAYGVLNPAPIYVFPKPGRNNKIRVTKLTFSRANSGQSNKVIKVDLVANVWIRKNPYTHKDVYKTVSYTTKMALTSKNN